MPVSKANKQAAVIVGIAIVAVIAVAITVTFAARFYHDSKKIERAWSGSQR